MVSSLTSASRFEYNVKDSKKLNVKTNIDTVIAKAKNYGSQALAFVQDAVAPSAFAYAA